MNNYADNLLEFSYLPTGWAIVNLEVILKEGRIGLVRSVKEQSVNEGYFYIRMQHYNLQGNWNFFDITKVSATSEEVQIYELQENDLLFNTRNSYELVGKVAIWKFKNSGYLYNNNLLRLRFINGVLPQWVGYQMMSPIFRKALELSKSATTNVCAIYTKDLNSQTILLSPLNEQRRIVAKIEALKARSQRVKEALEDIPQLLDQFRQSVLAAAFRGDLTANWREQNPDVEPASVLLERIRTERRRKWSEELYNKRKNASKTKYDESIKPDANKLPKLPDSWIWVTLDQLLFALRNGLSKPPADEPPGIPILRISSVRAMDVNTNDIRFYRTDNVDDLSSYLLEIGDLLFTRYNGSRSFVGVCGIIPKITNDLLYPDKLIRGQLVDKSLSLPEYLELACNFGVSRSHIDSHIKTSAGQQGIAGSDIKSTPIPLPPLAEQHTIVRAVKQEFAAIRKLASLTSNCFQDLQSLDQSILAKAFRGELVPQDPDDEPASVLLERIRAERDKLQTKAVKKSTPQTGGRRSKKASQQEAEPVQLELGLE